MHSLTNNSFEVFIPAMAELNSQVTFRLTEKLYERLEEIAVRERRKQNEVARALLERGIAAYDRDEELFEPETEPLANNGRQSYPLKPTGKEVIKKRKNSGNHQ